MPLFCMRTFSKCILAIAALLISLIYLPVTSAKAEDAYTRQFAQVLRLNQTKNFARAVTRAVNAQLDIFYAASA